MSNAYNLSALGAALENSEKKNTNTNTNKNTRKNIRKNAFANVSAMMNALETIEQKTKKNANIAAHLERTAKAISRKQMLDSKATLKMLRNTRRALNHAARIEKLRKTQRDA